MSVPDPVSVMRKALSDATAVAALLLPQSSITGLSAPPVFGGEYPRKEAGYAATDPRAHDWAALLQQRAVKLLIVSPAGRVASGGDTTRAQWSRFRFDLLSMGETYADAAAVHWAAYAFLKDLFRVRAVLSTGTALIHDVTVEGGPISFPDPDTDCPVMVGIYAASVAEEHVA